MINEVMRFTDVFWLFFLEACVVFCVLVLFIDFFLSYGSFVRSNSDFALIFFRKSEKYAQVQRLL
jgi:hypothetical protein